MLFSKHSIKKKPIHNKDCELIPRGYLWKRSVSGKCKGNLTISKQNNAISLQEFSKQKLSIKCVILSGSS